MKLDASDIADLRPLIAAVVSDVLDRFEAQAQKVNGSRLAYPEPEAAELLGVQAHVLRDARRRGEVAASLVGKKMLYERTELARFLRERRAR